MTFHAPSRHSLFSPHHHLGHAAEDHPLPSRARQACVIVIGEFCGTFMFLLLSYIGTQTALNTNNVDLGAPLQPFTLMYIAASFGTALAVNVWIFYRVTGGMFNPAVTLGLLLVKAVEPRNALLIIPTQLVAAIAAAAVTDGLLPGPLTVGNALNNGTSVAQGLFLEMFLTAQLVLTVYFLAVEKHRGTFLAPVGIGFSVFIAHIAGTNWTGTSINPVRSFGPDVIQGFPSYHWIFWLGPLLGAILAFGLYRLLKWLEYQDANPGQDATDSDPERANRHRHRRAFREKHGHGRHHENVNAKETNAHRRNDSVLDGQSTSSP